LADRELPTKAKERRIAFFIFSPPKGFSIKEQRKAKGKDLKTSHIPIKHANIHSHFLNGSLCIIFIFYATG
jgi:hypothetical protein